MAWLAFGQVDQFGDVPGDAVVLLRPADRPDQRALDLYERGLGEYPGGVLDEPVGVGGLEVRQLLVAGPGVDPLLGLAAVGVQGVRVELERVEPVLDALPDGIGGWRVDAGLDLLVQLVELVFGLLPGLARTRRRRRFPASS
ncbi:MAG TPA: hypothetical protein VFW50_34495 [Streptosporangiaceae bacterium]|nr:hypothetical protein [Streptosporangiaceae bacterium]